MSLPLLIEDQVIVDRVKLRGDRREQLVAFVGGQLRAIAAAGCDTAVARFPDPTQAGFVDFGDGAVRLSAPTH